MNNSRLQTKLKLPKGRVNKNLDDYAKRVYELNKELIDKYAENAGEGLYGSRIDPLKYITSELKATMKVNEESAQDAIRRIGRTEAFTSREERRIGNVIEQIRKNPEVYRAFRLAWGWNRAIDWDLMEVMEDSNSYKIGNVFIDFNNSPFEIIIRSGSTTRKISLNYEP